MRVHASAFTVAIAMPLVVSACTNAAGPGPPIAAHVSAAACATCHSADRVGWAGTLHAASAAAVLTNVEHNSTEQLIDECIQCHAPFEAGRYHIGDFVQPVDTVGPWHLVPANSGAWEAIKCESCHDITGSAPQALAYYDPTAHAYAPVQNATQLCEKCHQVGTDDSRDLAGSVHAGLQCTDCHFQPGSGHSLDPTGACSRCHPGVNPKHPDVTKLNTTYASANSPNNIHFISCANCHWWAQP
jgi:hypothetical protein